MSEPNEDALLTDEEADLVVGAIPLQSLPCPHNQTHAVSNWMETHVSRCVACGFTATDSYFERLRNPNGPEARAYNRNRTLLEIISWRASFRFFRCVPENCDVFEQQQEVMVEYIDTLLTIIRESRS